MSASRSDPAYKRAYYLRNREAVLARVQKYRQDNLDRIADYRVKGARRIAARTMVRNAKKRAEENGVPFDAVYLTAARVQNALFRSSRCRACKKLFDFAPRGKMGPGASSATLDRKVNELGYVEGNVALLCWPCNKAKSTLSVSQLRALVEWLER